MLASVSPESYRAIINGQSDWGIFPLLLDFSIIKDLGATVPSLSHSGYPPIMQDICSASTRTKDSESHKKIMERAIEPGICRSPDGSVITSPHLLSENSDK